MCQALFERHKLVAATQLCVRVLLRGGSVSAAAAACLTNGSEVKTRDYYRKRTLQRMPCIIVILRPRK